MTNTGCESLILTKVDDCLAGFQPISLAETGKVGFSNRIDQKYIFSFHLLPQLLLRVADKYRVLQIDGHRRMNYSTLYLDTREKTMYYHHLQGRISRFKVRHRTYETTGDQFLEIKKKTNKGLTVKNRIGCRNIVDISEEDAFFLKNNSPFDFENLLPALANSFTRITLLSNTMRERVTLDFNLSFSQKNDKSHELPFLAIAEIKSSKASIHLGFARYIRQLGIYPESFSKYCIGMALTSGFGRNALKIKLSKINSIRDEFYSNQKDSL
jgi:hypothetical protein